jgi:hypothetical protein
VLKITNAKVGGGVQVAEHLPQYCPEKENQKDYVCKVAVMVHVCNSSTVMLSQEDL